MPQASIIVPAYNVQGTIAVTLNALLNQTFGDFESVVVDASTNDSNSADGDSFTIAAAVENNTGST